MSVRGGGTSDIWQCNYMVTSRYNTSTWVALCTLYIDTVSPDINRKGAYYYCSADGSRRVYWLPQLIPATNWKLLLSEQGHSWGYHQIENKHIKEVEIPSVSLNPSNPVLINSTIKFLFLNDRQDVEIRMLCGYWIVWESGRGSRGASRLICYCLSCKIEANIEYLLNRQDVTIYLVHWLSLASEALIELWEENEWQ